MTAVVLTWHVLSNVSWGISNLKSFKIRDDAGKQLANGANMLAASKKPIFALISNTGQQYMGVKICQSYMTRYIDFGNIV